MTWRRADSTSTDYKMQVLLFITVLPSSVPSWLSLSHGACSVTWHVIDRRLSQQHIVSCRQHSRAPHLCNLLMSMLWLFVNLETCLLCLLGLTPGATYWPQSALSGISLVGFFVLEKLSQKSFQDINIKNIFRSACVITSGHFYNGKISVCSIITPFKMRKPRALSCEVQQHDTAASSS